MKRNRQRKLHQLLALVLSGMGTTTTMAAGPLVQGGGSSLVQPLLGTAIQPATEIGLFGTSEANFSYYPVGSGSGQEAFFRNQPSFLNPQLTGSVYFANSDAALTTAQITSYQNALGATSGPLIQIPYLITPIAIAMVNAPAVTSATTPQTTPGQAHSIALNDDDLCGIFSGSLSNWNQVMDPEKLTRYPTAAIQVVYPAQASGTTELMTRHLAAVCPASSYTKAGITFVDSMMLASSFPNGMPSNFVAATSSSGVQRQLISNLGAGTAAVAYLSPAYTNTFLAPSSASASFQLQVASLLNSRNLIYYAPTGPNATTAVGLLNMPVIRLAAAKPANWVPTSGRAYMELSNPHWGYPVSGTSQIILSQCYTDPGITTAVHDFLNDHYTNPAFAALIRGYGFDPVPESFQAPISNDFLSNPRGWNLDIGNASACSGTVTGR
ncbi:substrate-binding domain-containing protein [Paraburkholderia sp. BL21I4N1]|uniref:substrate-binding domain-containing protein n=1 Tax=Paraburkholderia sp. BL21I4N1 TaxID=1938801 RepID=UPI000D42F384|nr:substrate-binding domain-containing protein [Paraburkholderia sp. BL21I4N1]PQV46061.1 periplasmic binding family protein [Paraburkholderia sp. BL21I4N1]